MNIIEGVLPSIFQSISSTFFRAFFSTTFVLSVRYTQCVPLGVDSLHNFSRRSVRTSYYEADQSQSLRSLAVVVSSKVSIFFGSRSFSCFEFFSSWKSFKATQNHWKSFKIIFQLQQKAQNSNFSRCNVLQYLSRDCKRRKARPS